MDKVKIGMISFAHGHAYSYLHALIGQPHVEVVGIADENKARVEGILGQYGLSYYGDYRELLAREDLDAVVVCSENVYHARITIDAAHAGKHVLCEKPLGISMEEMHRMIRACEDNGVQLMTAFPCRYLPGMRAAKEAVNRGEIGEVIALKGTNRGSMPGGWFVDRSLSGGGAMLDHTVHVADLMRWILGDEIEEVYAESGTLFHDLEVDDTGMLNLKFASGAIAVLDTSWSRSKSFPTWGDVTLELVGEHGVIALDGFAQKYDLYNNKNGKGVWKYWGDDMDRLLIADFVRALRSGESVPISGWDGLRATEAALAAYRSVQERAPVRLSVGSQDS